MADNPTFQIPRDVIEPILQAHVSAAVAQAFGAQHFLIEKFINEIVTRRVKEDGNTPSYSSDKTVSWLDWAVGSVITKVIKEQITAEVEKHKEEMSMIISKELQRKNSPLIKQLAMGMVGAFANQETLKYRFEVKIAGLETRY
jgi:pullulanase/glycogen debranching enzyme